MSKMEEKRKKVATGVNLVGVPLMLAGFFMAIKSIDTPIIMSSISWIGCSLVVGFASVFIIVRWTNKRFHYDSKNHEFTVKDEYKKYD